MMVVSIQIRIEETVLNCEREIDDNIEEYGKKQF